MNLIDLTHTLSPDIPSWDGDCGFRVELDVDYTDCAAPDLFRTQRIATRAGMGTHIDAPAHCIPGGKTIDRLDLKDLVARCAVIRVDDRADAQYIVMPDVIERFESANGKIQPETFVIVHTGWSTYWNAPERYRNNLQFPSVHESTAQLLIERGIVGLGTDTLSADAQGRSFPVHRAILGAGKYLVENIANASELPASGAQIFVLPMKIEEGTEAPVRLVAVI